MFITSVWQLHAASTIDAMQQRQSTTVFCFLFIYSLKKNQDLTFNPFELIIQI